MPTVSILVSCYNVSKFIDKWIENLYSQPFQDFELILVDDGSKDDTFEKCQSWANKHNNIKIIRHSENRGLGAGRNTSLEAATGKYVYFSDVDDEMYSELLPYCVNEMESKSLDMMIFGFDAVIVGKEEEVDRVEYKERLITSNEQIKDIFVEEIMLARHGSGFVWNKFYRRSFLEENSLRFGNQTIQQDQPFTLKVLEKVNRFYISPKVLYKYYIYSFGNNRSRYIPNRFEIYLEINEAFESLLDKWGIKSDKAQDYLDRRLWGGLNQTLLYDLKHDNCSLSRKKRRERYKYLVDSSKRLGIIKRLNTKTTWKVVTFKTALKTINSSFCFYSQASIFNFLRKIKKDY